MSFYKKYVAFVEKNRKKLFILMILINIVALFGLLRIHISTDFNVFMPKKSHAKELYDKMNQTFQTDEQLMVMVEFENDILNVAGMKKIFEILDLLKVIDGVKSVVAPLPEKLPVGFKMLDMRKVTPKSMNEVIKFISTMEEMVNIKKKDGKYYAMFIIIPRNGFENIEGMVDEIEKKLRGYKFYISGNTYLESKIFDYILLIIFILPPLAFILILNVFRWQIGNFKATIFSVMPAGIAALWTMGILGWIGKELSVVTVLVPIFTIVMGSADGLHFVSHFLENKVLGYSNSKSLAITLSSVGRAMIMTTLTTIAGFISLVTINSQSMVQMGIFASIGIGFAAVATWFILPVILIESKQFELKKPSIDISAFFEKFTNKRAFVVSILIVILFIPGLFFLNGNFNMLKVYKNYTKVRKNVEKIQDVFGSALPTFLIYKGTGNLFDPKFANDVLELQKRIIQIKGIKKIVSVYDIVAAINEYLYGQKGYPTLLPRAILIQKLLPKEQLSNFIDYKGETGRSMIFLSNLENETLENLGRSVKLYKNKGNFYLTGIPFIIKEMNDSIISQQLKSLLLALIFVFTLLLLPQRNFVTPILSIIPISITLVVLFGFMGYLGIDLNVITINMASIVIGVGIDYSIHFIELYKYYLKIEKNNALHRTFKSASKPILANALGLAIGLTALFFSPLTTHSYLAGIMWVTMLTSSFVSLTLLPFLVARFYRN